jgi:hypothetical protein
MPTFSYFHLFRGFFNSLLVLLVLAVLMYGCFCTRAEGINSAKENSTVIMVGRVSAVYDASSGAAVFELADPSGRVFVKTDVGPPRLGTVVLVSGVKVSTDTGRPLVVERRRGGTF